MVGERAILVLVGPQGTPAAAGARALPQAPLVEAEIGRTQRDSDPIWVRNPGNSSTVVVLAKAVHAYLARKRFSCVSELQSDSPPKKETKILGDFTVYSHPRNCREPNYAGIVTVYDEGAGAYALKLSPETGYGKVFGAALRHAIRNLPQPADTLRIERQSG
jgi:hypothetical protein